ncbi:MAG: ligase-associated DNA damage response DEXH box helicase, partial [Bacteroidia bacterium]|nr:ligase-associated DNA damage response DEXH box helicase [Bacteroidia bacterium]
MKKELIGYGQAWFRSMGWKVFPFQMKAWKAYLQGESGIINAPTGSGKTYSLLMPALLEFIRDQEGDIEKTKNGLQIIWITPIRALSKEIAISANRAINGLGLKWKVSIRTGDTSTKDRTKQREQPPEILITTPESMHLLIASKGYKKFFGTTKAVIVDEWHELLGSKRGVQMELALSRLLAFIPDLKVWGISATIGNMDEALAVLMGKRDYPYTPRIIKADIEKEIELVSILPDKIEEFSWGGHLGIKLLKKIVPIIFESDTTLIFTNTRAQCEIWYQKLIHTSPDLIGLVAVHHGSLSRELRDWVEEQLYLGKLKAVVCTSSLDLGVDFRPVDTIIQVGSPKGVARFMQRAGRSGHRPGEKSRIYFLPTHAMELMEGPALRDAIANQNLEYRMPYIRSFDVLIQYLTTLAVSEGFDPKIIYDEVKSTFAYSSISEEEWNWVLAFITTGGASLQAYNEYQKVGIDGAGIFRIKNRAAAMRHRLSIGTIVSNTMMNIKFTSGRKIGSIEEYFISQLMPGDNFWFAGRSLELVRIKGLDVQVRKSSKKSGKIPSYSGGRMPLTSQLSESLRSQIDLAARGEEGDIELKELIPLTNEQARRSIVPTRDQFLIEYFESKEGYHLLLYPFEGRFANEGIGTLVAYRMSQIKPMSFSIAMNDYGVELLCNQVPPLEALED